MILISLTFIHMGSLLKATASPHDDFRCELMLGKIPHRLQKTMKWGTRDSHAWFTTTLTGVFTTHVNISGWHPGIGPDSVNVFWQRTNL